MPAADRRFFGRAWASLASTRNVFGKLCLIALLQFVPILGQIVALGYFLGWVREAAWGMETPAPAHVLSGGDRAFWPRGAKAWVTTLLYGLIEAAFICILGAVWTFFGHMQGGIVDDIVLGVLVAAGLCGTILLTICCYVGLVRLAVYNRFGAAWQWGKSLQMAGRDFGGLLKLFFGTVGLNVLISIFVGAVYAIMVLGFTAGAAVPILSDLAYVTSAGLEGFISWLVGIAGMLVVTAPLWLVLSFLLNIPYLVITAVCWRALGNWAAQFDVPRWGAMTDPLPEPRAESVRSDAPVRPAAPSAAQPTSDCAAAAQEPMIDGSATPEAVSPAPVADGAASLPGTVAGEGGPSAASEDTSSTQTTPSPAFAGSSETPHEEPSVPTSQAPTAPQKRSHPIGVIVLCLLGSLVLSVAMGALTSCGALGISRGAHAAYSNGGVAGSTLSSPDGLWMSSDGQSVMLTPDDGWDKGSFTWHYDASGASYAQGTYVLEDVSDGIPNELYGQLLRLDDPEISDLVGALLDLGVTPRALGVGVYHIQMTAESGVLNGQDATSSAAGNVVNCLLIAYGDAGLLVDYDVIQSESYAGGPYPDGSVLFVTR